jgi:hypothetical protein
MLPPLTDLDYSSPSPSPECVRPLGSAIQACLNIGHWPICVEVEAPKRIDESENHHTAIPFGFRDR